MSPSSLSISVVITGGDETTPGREATLASIRAQTHSHWRLETADEASDDQGQSPPGIDLVVIVAAGDLLHPEALAELAHHADVHPLVDALYTDEEQAGEAGGAPQPFLKPDWSPELLQSLPYVLHCLCLRRDLYVRMGGLSWGADEAGVYDFALRATSAARAVGHVARVLCRRPRLPIVHDGACLRAVAAAAASLAPPADAAPGLIPGTYRIVRSRDQRPPVTLVVITGDPIVDVPGRGARRILADFLRTIVELSTYPDFRILVVDDGELSEESAAVVSQTHSRAISHSRAGAELRGFSFSRKVNFALEHVETEHFVLLNDDLTVVTPDWIEALMDYGVNPQVGAVGAHLEFPDGRTQHAGVVATPSGPTHRFYGLPPGARDQHGPHDVVRNFSAVTAAVLASRREVIEAVGPFDEAFPRYYNDIDFCLRALARGYRVVYTPFARLRHFEHASLRVGEPTREELARFRKRWGAWCEHDPHYRRP